MSAESLRARTLLRSVHSTFSSSHILASSLESFPFAKNRKILHSEPSVKHPPLQYETPPCECDCSPILTLPVDVGCVALYEFWERENSLEKRVRCGKARNVSVRGTWCIVTLPARTHCLRSARSPFSPSHTLASSLESFPFRKNRKMLTQ